LAAGITDGARGQTVVTGLGLVIAVVAALVVAGIGGSIPAVGGGAGDLLAAGIADGARGQTVVTGLGLGIAVVARLLGSPGQAIATNGLPAGRQASVCIVNIAVITFFPCGGIDAKVAANRLSAVIVTACRLLPIVAGFTGLNGLISAIARLNLVASSTATRNPSAAERRTDRQKTRPGH
jgi:hypothetical protein